MHTLKLKAGPQGRSQRQIIDPGVFATATNLADNRATRSVGDTPPDIPSGCSMSAVQGGDDDDDGKMVNWTNGALHCSNAGLTALPPVPSNAIFMYVALLLLFHRPLYVYIYIVTAV